MNNSTILLALGGNAILQSGQAATYANQLENVKTSARFLARLIQQGYRLVVTHGNGPQVGNLLRQNEEAASVIPPMPLDVLNSQTQGFIGYMMQQCIANELAALGCPKPVVSVVTRVEVSPTDPAFASPAKPVGMFYDEATAKMLHETKGWQLQEDSGRGWRRVVPSPMPLGIVEKDAILQLVHNDIVTISCGGGGIAVHNTGNGHEGVEAVIDKDLSGAVLAQAVEAETFLIVTDVPHVFINYGTPAQQGLEAVTLAEMEQHEASGQFAKGSMGPKVAAALKFARATGKTAIICALDKIDLALEGKSGTRIVATK